MAISSVRARWGNEMEIRDGNFTHTFRMCNPQAITFGETYFNAEICYTNLAQHETLESLVSTVIHESIHAALKREGLDDEVEHELMKRLFWHLDDLC